MVLDPCTARFAAGRSDSSTRYGTNANPQISNTTPATPARKATAASSGIERTSRAHAAGTTANRPARSRSAGTIKPPRSRPSAQCPTSSDNNKFGSMAAVATRLTPPGPASKLITATSGSATADTCVPRNDSDCPAQYHRKAPSRASS